MKKIILIVLGLWLHVHAYAHTDGDIVVDEEEKIESVNVFHLSAREKLTRISGRHVDGVRGYTVSPHLEGGITERNDRSTLLRNFACNEQVFGIYELEAAKSFAGKDDIGVFTKYRFKLIDDWRDGNSLRSKVIHMTVEGGEIDYNGEKIRVENPLLRYVIGGRYFLSAGSRGKGGDKLVYAYSPFIEISNGTLYPAPGIQLFPSGMSVSKAKVEVLQSLQKKGCE